VPEAMPIEISDDYVIFALRIRLQIQPGKCVDGIVWDFSNPKAHQDDISVMLAVHRSRISHTIR
jgi:hypothetical protein